MYMHSGDVMVMSGPSRLRYHAVPRILVAAQGQTTVEMEGSSPASALQPDSVVEPLAEDDWVVCCRYIQSSRVNMTVRQVLAPGQNFPEAPLSTPKLMEARKRRTMTEQQVEKKGKGAVMKQ